MLLKTRTSWDQIVEAPSVESIKGPVCMTCGRIVDSEQLVEGYPAEPEKGRPGSLFCKVLVKHHGAEELRTFEMGSDNWDERDLAQMMRRTNWFDPTKYEGLGLAREVKNVHDHDGGDVFDGSPRRETVEK